MHSEIMFAVGHKMISEISFFNEIAIGITISHAILVIG